MDGVDSQGRTKVWRDRFRASRAKAGNVGALHASCREEVKGGRSSTPCEHNLTAAFADYLLLDLLLDFQESLVAEGVVFPVHGRAARSAHGHGAVAVGSMAVDACSGRRASCKRAAL